MTQKQIINAYITLVRLGGVQMPVRVAHALYMLRRALEPTYQFCAEQEHSIMEQYNGKPVNGTISFDNPDAAKAAQDALSNLYDLEVEFTIHPVNVSFDEINGCTLTVNDIESLDGFVNLS